MKFRVTCFRPTLASRELPTLRNVGRAVTLVPRDAESNRDRYRSCIFICNHHISDSGRTNELGMKLFPTLEETEKIKKDCKNVSYDYFCINSDYKKISSKEMLYNQIVLGVAYNDLRKYKNATKAYKEALRTYDKEIPLDYLEMVGKIKSLQGRNYTDQGKYKKAKRCMAAAMYILWNLHALRTSYCNFEESRQCRLSSGEILDNLSVFSNFPKKEEEEVKIEQEVEDTIAYFNDKFEQVVKSNLNDADKCRFSLIEIWYNLGEIYRNSVQEEDSNKAKEYLKKAMEVFQAFYGENHPWVAVVRLNLAKTHKKLGELQEAFFLAESALALFKKIVGENHPQVVQALNILGKICSDLKDFQTSEKCHKDALMIIDKICHNALFSDSGQAHMELGYVMKSNDKLTQSLQHFEKAKDSFIAVYGSKHRKVAKCNDLLGEVHRMLEEKEKILMKNA